MKCLTKKQIVFLHHQLILNFGGLDGLKDESLLESALSAPFQSFSYRDLFPTVLEKAARLGFGLVSNHCFIDGNKRIGAHAMLVFLELNDVTIEYTQEGLIKIFLDLASGKAGYKELLQWLKERVV